MAIETPTPAIVDYSTNYPARWAQWLMAALGWGYYSVLVIGATAILWEGRYPGSFLARFFCVVMFLCMGAYWGVRALVRWELCRRYGWPPVGAGRGGVVLVVTMGLVAALVWGEVASWVAFRVSEPAMRQKAEAILAAGGRTGLGPTFRPEWVGLFHFRGITHLPGRGVYFYTGDGEFFCDEGWTYSPGGMPEAPVGEAGPGTQTPDWGPWYRTRLWW